MTSCRKASKFKQSIGEYNKYCKFILQKNNEILLYYIRNRWVTGTANPPGTREFTPGF